jgi:ribosomal small subunit protein bTHX
MESPSISLSLSPSLLLSLHSCISLDTRKEEPFMGRGDQRSKRGKISRGTSGKRRINPKQKKRARAAKRAAAKAAA